MKHFLKLLPLLAAALGLAATVTLVLYFGADGVLESLAAVGIGGFAVICLIHLTMIVLMGLAWRALLPGCRSLAAIWGRLVRDAGSEALPLSQVGGYVLGARALILAGVSGTGAAASTIVDVTLEFAAQVAYTAIGLFWLVRVQPDSDIARPITVGLGVAAVVVTAFFLVQRHAIGHVDRIAHILGGGWAERTAWGAAALQSALIETYRRRAGLWASFLLHLVCWIASAAEAWMALALAGSPLNFGEVLVIESMLYAIRTLAFFVPNAVGVQEGAYILLGGSFGLTPEVALALSLLKRARDLAIGLPVIGAWQIVESGRLWRAFGGKARPAAPAATPAPPMVPAAGSSEPAPENAAMRPRTRQSA